MPERWPLALSTGAVLAGTGLGLARQGGAGALDTLWAEDGEVFLSQAVLDPGGSLLTSYAGYYHVLPRLLAVVSAQLPAAWASGALASGAALVTAVFAVAAYHLSATHLPSRLARYAVSVPVAALPVAQGDVLNSPANLHWTGLYLLFWLLLCRPVGAAGNALAVLAILLIAGSDILAACYAPLAVLVWWLRRDRYALSRAVALGTALAVQFAGLLTGASEREGLRPDPLLAIASYPVRLVPTALLGERWAGTEVSRASLLLAALAWLLLAGGLFVAWRDGGAPRWRLAGAAVLHSVVLYLVPVGLSGVATPRYAVAPVLLLLVALVAVLLPARGGTGLRLLVGLLLVSCAVNFRVDNPRAAGPTWSDELRRARQSCTAATLVHLTIPPGDANWRVTLSCEYVRGPKDLGSFLHL